MMPPATVSVAAPDSPSGFRHFHDQLANLKERLLTMSDRAEGLVDLAVDALLKHDQDRADAVITGDREIDALEVEVEGLAVELLALQQPMARDLRFIVSAIKISSDLERVGDHAVNIAQCAQRLIAIRSTITPEPEIEDMARRARGMLGDALDAFIRADGTLGREVCKSDDAVDALLNSLFRILLDPHDGGRPEHHAVARAHPGGPQPGAGRRSGDEHRRGRRVPGRGKADQAPPGRPDAETDAGGAQRGGRRDRPSSPRSSGGGH